MDWDSIGTDAVTKAVVKWELSQKAKLSICKSKYVPILTYGHVIEVVTERIKLQIQAVQMSFLCRVSGLSLTDKVRSLDILKSSMQSCFSSKSRGASWAGTILSGCLLDASWGRCFGHAQPGGAPRTDQGHTLCPPEELETVVKERNIYIFLKLLPQWSGQRYVVENKTKQCHGRTLQPY